MNVVINRKVYELSEDELDYLSHFLFPYKHKKFGIDNSIEVMYNKIPIGYLAHSLLTILLKQMRRQPLRTVA